MGVCKYKELVELFLGIVKLGGKMRGEIDGFFFDEMEELFETKREEWMSENFRGEIGEGLRWGRAGGVMETWMRAGEGDGICIVGSMMVWREVCEEGVWGREGGRG